MNPMSPRSQHVVEQYMALSLEVQTTLVTHKAALIAEGWSDPEAWALCQRVEERILGPMIDWAEGELRDESETIDQKIARMLREEREGLPGDD